MNTIYAIPFLLLPSSLLPSSAHFPRYAVFIYLFLTSRHMVGVYYSVYVKSEIVCLLIRYFKPLQLIFVKGIALPYWLSCFLYPFLRSSSSFPFLNPITPFLPHIFPALQFCSLHEGSGLPPASWHPLLPRLSSLPSLELSSSWRLTFNGFALGHLP